MSIPLMESGRGWVASGVGAVTRAARPLLAASLMLGLGLGCAKKQEAAPATDATAWWGTETSQDSLDVSRFAKPHEITNQWMPLKPGLRLTYEGTAIDDEGQTIERKMQINVTDLTKVIGGVRSLVTWDLDWAEGQLVEAELAFFAQDDAGSIWLMGEYPEEYDDGNGVITANPAWFHGLDGARAGILVPAAGAPGDPSFAQGLGPAVGYSDRGRVDSVGVSTCVPVDCYDGVLVLAETSADEVELEQLKYYAPGVGHVRVSSRGKNDKEKQVLWLTKIEMLDAKGLAELRTNALALDKKAIAGNKLYALTSPITGAGGGR